MLKTALLVINLLAAITGMIAALYWFKASQTTLPSINKETGVPVGPVSVGSLNKDIIGAARLNRIAATWSCAAATFGAISLSLGIF